MSYETDGLTFNALRRANTARLPEFRNKHGHLAHSMPDGSDWTPAQWLQAVVGELGEFANIRKKYERGDLTHEQFEIEAAKELADVQTYLDILARRCLDSRDGIPHPDGVDLGAATVKKFNEVSHRVRSGVRLDTESCGKITSAGKPNPVAGYNFLMTLWTAGNVQLTQEEDGGWGIHLEGIECRDAAWYGDDPDKAIEAAMADCAVKSEVMA